MYAKEIPSKELSLKEKLGVVALVSDSLKREHAKLDSEERRLNRDINNGQNRLKAIDEKETKLSADILEKKKKLDTFLQKEQAIQSLIKEGQVKAESMPSDTKRIKRQLEECNNTIESVSALLQRQKEKAATLQRQADEKSGLLNDLNLKAQRYAQIMSERKKVLEETKGLSEQIDNLRQDIRIQDESLKKSEEKDDQTIRQKIQKDKRTIKNLTERQDAMFNRLKKAGRDDIDFEDLIREVDRLVLEKGSIERQCLQACEKIRGYQTTEEEQNAQKQPLEKALQSEEQKQGFKGRTLPYTQKTNTAEKKRLEKVLGNLEAELGRIIKEKHRLSDELNSSRESLNVLKDKIKLVQIQIAENQSEKDKLSKEMKRSKVVKTAVLVEAQREQEEEMLKKEKIPPPTLPVAEDEVEAVAEPKDDMEEGGEEYKISPNDELAITVYGEPDLTKTVRVASDGTISYPLLGRLKVSGLSAAEAEEKIATMLSEGGFIVQPQVSVYVERFSTVSIFGEVRNPGSYEIKGKIGLLDAIAQAGGFNLEADMNNVKILRVEEGIKKTLQVRLGDIKTGIEAAEIALKPNDTIFVEKIGKITVLGEVSRPGTFELKERITILEAIAMAGGFTNVAAINSTRIIRRQNGIEKTLGVKITDITDRGKKNKDIELMPGDIVYVPESFF